MEATGSDNIRSSLDAGSGLSLRTMTDNRDVRIAIGAPGGVEYDVVIEAGAARSIGRLLREHAASPHYIVIADAVVAGPYGDAVLASVRETGARADLLAFAAIESSKTRAMWAELTDRLIARGAGRDACVVALGGGVTTDLAGFVAATFMRGLAYVQVPTTLLAMIDASIGGKTGVDTEAGKNLVGAFHHPRLVVVDPEFLATLPVADLCSGLAEAVKHGAIADAAYLDRIRAEAGALLGRDAGVLEWLIRRSVEIKAGVATRDPYEHGERAVLNFGHTVAHALERLSGFAKRHGIAVAMGMGVEAELGVALGITHPDTPAVLRSVLRPLGLPAAVPAGTDFAAVVAATATDKKARAGRVRYTLLQRAGQAARSPDGEWTFPADAAAVEAALARAAAADGPPSP